MNVCTLRTCIVFEVCIWQQIYYFKPFINPSKAVKFSIELEISTHNIFNGNNALKFFFFKYAIFDISNRISNHHHILVVLAIHFYKKIIRQFHLNRADSIKIDFHIHESPVRCYLRVES